MAIQITTTAERAGFDAGVVLDKPEDILAYVNDAFVSSRDGVEDCGLEADALVSLIEDVQNENPADTDEDFEIHLFEALDAGDTNSADEKLELGETLSALLDKADADGELNAVINDAIESTERVARSPLVLALRFAELFSEAERAMFPVPGSETGNNPDMFNETYLKNNGERGERKVSRVKAWVMQHHIVAGLIESKDKVKETIPQGGKAGPEHRRQEKMWNARIVAAVKAMTNGIRIIQNLDTMKASKLVEIDIEMTDMLVKGKKVLVVAPGQYPIAIIDRVKKTNIVTVTPNAFARMKADPKAKWADFTKSGRRAPRAGKLQKIDAKSFGLVVKSLAHALSATDSANKLNKVLTANTDEALEVGSALLDLEDRIAEMLPAGQRARFGSHRKSIRLAVGDAA